MYNFIPLCTTIYKWSGFIWPRKGPFVSDYKHSLYVMWGSVLVTFNDLKQLLFSSFASFVCMAIVLLMVSQSESD